jgi:hypothetical protein
MSTLIHPCEDGFDEIGQLPLFAPEDPRGRDEEESSRGRHRVSIVEQLADFDQVSLHAHSLPMLATQCTPSAPSAPGVFRNPWT